MTELLTVPLTTTTKARILCLAQRCDPGIKLQLLDRLCEADQPLSMEPPRPILLLEHCTGMATMMRNYQLAAACLLEQRHFITHWGGATEHVPALCVEAAQPGDCTSHPNIPGGSPDSVPGVATVPCTHNVHSQGTTFYGAGNCCASSHHTHATLSPSCPDVAYLQTCEYGSHF